MKGSDFVKNVSVSFDADEQAANYLKNFIKEYRKFTKSQKAYVLNIIENFLKSWDPDTTDVKPDERVKKMIELTRPAYHILMIERESRNFKFKVIEENANAASHK